MEALVKCLACESIEPLSTVIGNQINSESLTSVGAEIAESPGFVGLRSPVSTCAVVVANEVLMLAALLDAASITEDTKTTEGVEVAGVVGFGLGFGLDFDVDLDFVVLSRLDDEVEENLIVLVVGVVFGGVLVVPAVLTVPEVLVVLMVVVALVLVVVAPAVVVSIVAVFFVVAAAVKLSGLQIPALQVDL